MNKNEKITCLVVTSEPYFWKEYIEQLEKFGVNVILITNAKETLKKLQKEKYTFAVISNTMFGKVGKPPKNGFEYDPYNVGLDYLSEPLEEKKIPYFLLCTAREVPKGTILPSCLWTGKSSSILPSEMVAILEEKKII